MNKERVVNIIREPLRMETGKDLPLIKELIEEFPYFSAPYVLLTKLLSEQKSIYLDKYLKLSASYIGDREVLYNFIHEPVLQDEEVAAPVLENLNVTTESSKETSVIHPPAETNSVDSHIDESQKMLSSEENVKKGDLQNEFKANSIFENSKPAEIENNVESISPNIPAEESSTEKKVYEIQEVKDKLIETVSESDDHKLIETRDLAIDSIPKHIEESKPIKNQAELLEEARKPEIVVPGNSEITSQGDSKIETGVSNKSEEKYAEEKEYTSENTADKSKLNRRSGLEISTLGAYDYFASQDKENTRAARKERKEEEENSFKLANEKLAEVSVVENKIEVEKAVNPDDLISQKKGKISFGSWLTSISSNENQTGNNSALKANAEIKNPEILSPPKAERKPKKEDVENIISKFIQSEPRIKSQPAKFFTPQDVAERSAETDNRLVTETLANIYLKQGLNEKAIEIFQQLMLKYPQKSNYFAVKIQEIKPKAL